MISIRFDFATKNISRMIWIPDSLNLADSGTKTHSKLAERLQLMLVSGLVPIDLFEATCQSSDQFTGWNLFRFTKKRDCQMCPI